MGQKDRNLHPTLAYKKIIYFLASKIKVISGKLEFFEYE